MTFRDFIEKKLPLWVAFTNGPAVIEGIFFDNMEQLREHLKKCNKK